MKKTKAKFRLGQIVIGTAGEILKIRWIEWGERYSDSAGNECWHYGDEDGWFHESELRPLTKREKGHQ